MKLGERDFKSITSNLAGLLPERKLTQKKKGNLRNKILSSGVYQTHVVILGIFDFSEWLSPAVEGKVVLTDRRINIAKIQFAVLLACFLSSLIGFAQTSSISFEVASVKENKSHKDSCSWSTANGGFVTENVPLPRIIHMAYGLKAESQLVGLPTNFEHLAYDINAKPDEATHKELLELEPGSKLYREMIQALLVERFHLVVHHEVRNLSGFALVVAKNAPKLETAPSLKQRERGRLQTAPGEITAERRPLDELTSFLSGETELADRPVVDKTGLKGLFTYHLKWAPDSQRDAVASTGDVAGPSLFTAIQEQLGLKLEPQKLPTDVVVIDHIEKPTEN